MEQTELLFPQTGERFAISITCDGVIVDLPEGAPDSFDSHESAQEYLTKVKALLEDSAYGIRIDLHQSGWSGVQKQGGMAVFWQAKVHTRTAPQPIPDTTYS